MNTTSVILIGLLLISLAAPFASLYAVSLIKKRAYKSHRKIQNIIFMTCIAAVVIFEVHLRLSGGSGSLIPENAYTRTAVFKGILFAHIIGAVLTYLLWGWMIFLSNRKYRKIRQSAAFFSKIHRRMGYIAIGGMFYTIASALVVCYFSYFF